MKAIKRTVAALLATLMLATSTSFTLAAEEFTDAQEVAMAKVNAASIMTGNENGDFMPSKSLTRAEAAAIIVRMKGISKSASDAAAGKTLFNDVAASHWASGYVNQASNLGIVKGVSATEFAPDREVTIAEFVTMAVRALGAGQLVDSEGTWPTNYVNFANENDILKDVPGIYTAVAKRVEAATIVANTIEAIMWEKNGVKSNGEISWQKSLTKDTIVDDVLDLDPIVGVVVDDIDYYNSKIKFSGESGYREVSKSFDLTTIKLGYAYDGYENEDDEVLGLWKAVDNKTKAVSFEEIVKVNTDSIKVMVDGEEKEYDLVQTKTTAPVEYKVPTYYNNAPSTIDAVTVLNPANVTGTLTIKNNEVVTIYMNEYTHAGVVDEVTTKKVKFDTLKGMDASLTAAEDLTIDATGIKNNKLSYFVEKDGKEIDVTDIEEGDVVFYYTEKAAGKAFHVVVMDDAIEGKVSATSSSYVRIDGTKYNYSGALSATPSAKDEVKLFLNAAGKVFAYDEIEGNSEFAVVSSLELVKNTKDEIKAEVVLTLADGTAMAKAQVNVKADAKIADKYVGLASLIGDSTNAIFKADNTLQTDVTLKDANTAAQDTSKSILGSVVAYEKDGDKLVLREATSKIKAIDDTEFVNRSTSYFVQDSKNYLVNKNTDILVVKADNDDNYKVKVSTVDASTLETTTGSANKFKAAMVDVNDDNYVSLVVLYELSGNKVKKGNQIETWSVVLDRTDDIDSDDYDAEVTVANEDGSIETYYTNSASIVPGVVGFFTITDKEITDFDADGYNYVLGIAKGTTPETYNLMYRTSEKNGFFNYIDGSKISSKANIKSYVLAEDVVYIAIDDDDFVKGSDSDIDNAETNDSDVTITDATEIVSFVTYTEDDVTELVAVIYNK